MSITSLTRFQHALCADVRLELRSEMFMLDSVCAAHVTAGASRAQVRPCEHRENGKWSSRRAAAAAAVEKRSHEESLKFFQFHRMECRSKIPAKLVLSTATTWRSPAAIMHGLLANNVRSDGFLCANNHIRARQPYAKGILNTEKPTILRALDNCCRWQLC